MYCRSSVASTWTRCVIFFSLWSVCGFDEQHQYFVWCDKVLECYWRATPYNNHYSKYMMESNTTIVFVKMLLYYRCMQHKGMSSIKSIHFTWMRHLCMPWRHKGSRCLASLNLILDRRWRTVVSVVPWTLHLHGTDWIGAWVGPRAGMGVLEKRKIFATARN